MYIDYAPKFDEVVEVIDDLSELTKEELVLSFGKKYREKIINILSLSEFLYLIRLKNDNSPIGIFGLIEEDCYSAGIFFLTTDKLYQGNMIKMIKTSKIIIDEWLKSYNVLFDDCHKNNLKIKKWLEFLGFEQTGNIKQGGFIEYSKRVKNA